MSRWYLCQPGLDCSYREAIDDWRKIRDWLQRRKPRSATGILLACGCVGVHRCGRITQPIQALYLGGSCPYLGKRGHLVCPSRRSVAMSTCKRSAMSSSWSANADPQLQEAVSPQVLRSGCLQRLIWIVLVKRRSCPLRQRGYRWTKCRRGNATEPGAIATVSHADIRGLVTDSSCIRRGASCALRSAIAAMSRCQ